MLKVARYALSILIFYLSASFFGFSKDRDYWVLSSSLVLILSQLFFGPLQDVYRIQFVADQAEHGVHKSLRTASALHTAILIFSALLILIGVCLKATIASWIAPGLAGPERADLSDMIAVVMPALALQQLMALLAAVLNSTSHFEFPEWAQIFSSSMALLFIVIGNERLGIYSLIAGTYSGYLLAIVMMLCHMKARYRSAFPFWSAPDRSILRYFSKACPLWIPFFAGQVLVYTEKALTSYLPQGQVSLFDYGRKLIELPMGVIIGITQSLFSVKISALHATKGLTAAAELSRDTLRFMIHALTPLTAIFLCCGEAIYELFFFGADAGYHFQRDFSSMMRAFSLAIPALCIYAVSSQTLVTFGRQRFSALLSTLFTLAVVLLDLRYFQYLGLFGLAFSWSAMLFLSSVSQLAIVLIFSRVRFKRFFQEIIFQSFIPISVAWAISHVFPFQASFSGWGLPAALGYIIFFLVTSLMTQFAMIWIFRLPMHRPLRSLFGFTHERQR